MSQYLLILLSAFVLAVGAMVAQPFTVIGREHHNGLVQDLVLSQTVQDLADVIVDALDHAEVLLDIGAIEVLLLF